MTQLIDALIGLSIGASLVALAACGIKVAQLVMDLMYRGPR